MSWNWSRAHTILQWALPLSMAAGVAVIWLSGISGGRAGAALALAMMAGALLGWGLALTLGGVLTMAGVVPVSTAVTPRRLQQLERDKLALLRSIKDLELDAAVHKLDRAEADILAKPLRARAKLVLRQLDEARQETTLSVNDQIEHELARRIERVTRGEQA